MQEINLELKVGDIVYINGDDTCVFNLNGYTIYDFYWTHAEEMRFPWHYNEDKGLMGTILTIDETLGRHKYGVCFTTRTGEPMCGYFSRVELFDEADVIHILSMLGK